MYKVITQRRIVVGTQEKISEVSETLDIETFRIESGALILEDDEGVERVYASGAWVELIHVPDQS